MPAHKQKMLYLKRPVQTSQVDSLVYLYLFLCIYKHIYLYIYILVCIYVVDPKQSYCPTGIFFI